MLRSLKILLKDVHKQKNKISGKYWVNVIILWDGWKIVENTKQQKKTTVHDGLEKKIIIKRHYFFPPVFCLLYRNKLNLWFPYSSILKHFQAFQIFLYFKALSCISKHFRTFSYFFRNIQPFQIVYTESKDVNVLVKLQKKYLTKIWCKTFSLRVLSRKIHNIIISKQSKRIDIGVS